MGPEGDPEVMEGDFVEAGDLAGVVGAERELAPGYLAVFASGPSLVYTGIT